MLPLIKTSRCACSPPYSFHWASPRQLPQDAKIYCGHDEISWQKFAFAVEFFVKVETATHRLFEVMDKDLQYQYIPGWFEYVSVLGTSLLVDTTERLFRGYKEHERNDQDQASDYDSVNESESSSNEDESVAGRTAFSRKRRQRKRSTLVSKNNMQPLLSPDTWFQVWLSLTLLCRTILCMPF